jgi:hypothetical protein
MKANIEPQVLPMEQYNRTRLTPLAKSVLRLWLAGRRWNFMEKLKRYWAQVRREAPGLKG